MMLDRRPMVSRVGRTFRRLAYVETTFVATFGRAPLVDTSHIPDDEYVDIMEARAQRALSRRLREPRAWFSLERVDDRRVHVLGRKVVPWFRSPMGLTASISTSDGEIAASGLWTVPRYRPQLVAFLVLIAPFWVGLSLDAPEAFRYVVVAMIIAVIALVPVYAEVQWLGAFRLLQDAIGVRMTRLVIAHPSSRLHWQITHLACWLIWRDLQLDRGDGSPPVPA